MKTSVNQNRAKENTNRKQTRDFLKLSILLIAIVFSSVLSSCSQLNGQPTDKLTNLGTNLDIIENLQAANNHIEKQDGTISPVILNIQEITVLRAVICTGISNREPVGVAETFSTDVGRVYLFTQIGMPKGESSTIQHVWKHEGKTISVVNLEVQGPNWRTRSYKTIHKNMDGNWTVDVLTEEGTPLKTLSFNVE